MRTTDSKISIIVLVLALGVSTGSAFGAPDPPVFDPKYEERGADFLNRNWNNQALACLNEAIREHPKSARLHTLRAAAHLELGDYRDAVADCTKALKIDSSLSACYANRGAALVKLERYKEGLRDLDHALAINPNLADAYCNRAAAYCALRRNDDALTDLTKAIDLNPSLAQPYFLRGLLESHMEGQEESAQEDFKKAFALEPKLSLVYENLTAGK